MGQILSHSEVEAILAGLDLTGGHALPTAAPDTASANPNPAEQLTLYDFEHPEPLRRPQLDALRLASATTCQTLQIGLSTVLRQSVAVNFLGVEQSTFRDYLATTEQPGCLAVFESSVAAGTWLLDVGRSLGFTMVDCLLGGTPSDVNPATKMARPFTDVETRLIEKAVQTLLPKMTAGLAQRYSLTMSRLISDSSLLAEAASNEAVALVSFEVICGPVQGLMQLCVPWKQVADSSDSLLTERGEIQEKMKSGAVKVPVTATARVARMKLSARELAGLNPGDILLTDAAMGEEIRLEIDGQEIFRGTPGQSHDRKVILLTTPIVPKSTDEPPGSNSSGNLPK